MIWAWQLCYKVVVQPILAWLVFQWRSSCYDNLQHVAFLPDFRIFPKPCWILDSRSPVSSISSWLIRFFQLSSTSVTLQTALCISLFNNCTVRVSQTWHFWLNHFMSVSQFILSLVRQIWNQSEGFSTAPIFYSVAPVILSYDLNSRACSWCHVASSLVS